MNHIRATRVLGIFITTVLFTVFLLPVAPAQADITRHLTVGSRGADVTELQKLLILKQHLSSGNATGYFGLLTAAAVRKLQAANSLETVGFVGPRTRALVNALLTGLPAGSNNTSAVKDFGDGDLSDLFEGGTLSIPPADAPVTANSFSVKKDASVQGDNGSSVVLTKDTTGTSDIGATVDVTTLSIENLPDESVTPPDPESVVAGAMQWGSPDKGLKFSKAFTVRLPVKAKFNGETLDVYRAQGPGKPWTQEGIVTPTCVVSNNICQFTATHASRFVATKRKPTVTLSVSPTSVSYGGSATLTWSSAKAVSCAASGGWSGAKNVSGTETISNLIANQTFTLTCTNAAGSTAKTVSVTVTGTAPDTSAPTTPSNLVGTAAGQTQINLTWGASTDNVGVTEYRIFRNAAQVGTTAGLTYSDTGLTAGTSYSYTVSAADAAGNVSGPSIAVSVATQALPIPTLTLSANPTSITVGQSSTLTWSSVNATSCTGSGFTPSGTSGTQSVSPTVTTSYSVTCTGAGGSVTQSTTVTVTAAPVLPTVTISASPTSITSGSSATLSWSSTNATSCTASNGWTGTKATSGTQSVAPTANTTYTLTCTGAGGSANQSTTVTVTTTPPPTGYPNASNTGVPAGTSLTAYTGPTTITTANTVITGKAMGCITVAASGVIIRNSTITCTGAYALYVDDQSWNASWTPLLVEDSEISCGNRNASGFGEGHATMRRVDVSGCENGFDVNQALTLEDSYVHNLYNANDAHADGLQMASGHFENGVLKPAARDVTIRHNTIYATDDAGAFGTSAIISNSGGDTNILIDNNLMAGGAATLYCEQNATGINYRVTNNHFSTIFKPTVGYFMIVTDCQDEIFTGNIIHETGQVVNSDGSVGGAPPPPPSTKFIIGDRVQVSSGPLNVRATANTTGTLLGTQATGALGTVTGGPTAQGGFNWWNINYDTGVDGWSAEDFLVKYTAPTPAPTITLSASPTSITSGSSATLSWSSTNATSCTASNGWTGTKATSGTQSVSPTATATYTLTCTGAGGSANQSTSVTVNAVTPPPASFIEAESATLSGGASVGSDSNASGGQYTQFASGATSGSRCAAFPSFPDANCTGVLPGTTLTPSSGMTISVAGTIIDSRDITGPIVVNAPNVTIRNSRIRSNAMWIIDNNSTGLVIEDSEIFNLPVAGQNNCHQAIGDSNFTVRRTEISGCENAANIGGSNVTFEDNYIHDLDTTGPSYVWGNSPHTDGLQLSPGANNLVIRHNWIDPSPGGGVTAAIIMGVNGSQSNVWIEENYLDGRGAAYALYANRQNSTNININRNRMYKGYGYTACVKLGQTVTTFDDNRDAGTNALLPADNGSDGGCTN